MSDRIQRMKQLTEEKYYSEQKTNKMKPGDKQNREQTATPKKTVKKETVKKETVKPVVKPKPKK